MLGYGDLQFTDEIFDRRALRLFEHIRCGAGGDDMPAVQAGAGADVDHVVRSANTVLIVLDDDDGVADLLETAEGFDQPCVVALMQADRRLIQHIAHTDKARANLCGQPDALRLATAQRSGFAVEGEIAEADVEHKTQPCGDFADDRFGDLGAFFAELEICEKRPRISDGHTADIIDAVAGKSGKD